VKKTTMKRARVARGALGSLGLSIAASLALVSCGHSSASDPPDAAMDDGGDAAIPCGPSGLSKGPWVVAVDETSVKIRWEACRAGAPSSVSVTSEADGGAGAALRFDASETPFVVTNTYRAPLNPNATPDFAGTWYMRDALATGLARGTCYAYTLDADPAARGRFCTARASGDAVRFLSIGDTNPLLGDSTKNVLAQTLPKNPDFVVHGGDIEYYESTLETWAAWFPIMSPMLRQGAFFAAVGNHEDEKQNPGELAQYTYRFFGGAGFDGTDAYYRFESGGVWFFSIDTEQPIDPASVQGQWLVSELADASKKPGYRFSVVFMHRPLLTCGDTGDNPAAVQYYEPIFEQYGVPLVIQAHMHGYERFEYNGITYVTSAGGGGRMGDVNGNVARSYCRARVASGPFFHGVIFDIANGALTGTTIDDQGVVRDTFTRPVP
jgi:hypothetical protein